jgi:hypothetical protein
MVAREMHTVALGLCGVKISRNVKAMNGCASFIALLPHQESVSTDSRPMLLLTQIF